MTLRFLMLVSVLLALAGCVGVDSEADNTAPVARAGNDRTTAVGTSVTLDGSTSGDADGDTLSYTWTATSAPSGSTAALSAASTARPSLVPDKEGAYTLSLSVSDGRSSSTSTVNVSVVMPAIVLGQVEPIAGAVRLSLGSDFAGSVTWYVDQQALGTGTSSGGASVVWNAQPVTNGTHQLVARIHTSATGYQEVRRSVAVANVANGLTAGGFGNLAVGVYVAPGLTITRISALFDGKDLGTLTASNYVPCSYQNACYTAPHPRYIFSADSAVSGDHIMLITAVDDSGATRALSVLVPVSNAPVIALAQPANGTLVYGKLQVQGTAASDKGVTVTVKA